MQAEANGITSFTIYITFTFGYLLAAFTAGKRLTRVEALIVSALYAFAALSATFNFMSDLDFVAKALSFARDTAPTGGFNDPDFVKTYMVTLMSTGIVASLYFMWSVRRAGSSGNASPSKETQRP